MTRLEDLVGDSEVCKCQLMLKWYYFYIISSLEMGKNYRHPSSLIKV